MILIGQYDSPFVRRVAIAMRLYGMPFEHRPWSVFGDADKIAARIEWAEKLDALAPAALIIEAIIEEAGAKKALFSDLERAAPDAVLATNTSSLSVTALAAGLQRPARFLGLHPRLSHRGLAALRTKSLVHAFSDVPVRLLAQSFARGLKARPVKAWAGASRQAQAQLKERPHESQALSGRPIVTPLQGWYILSTLFLGLCSRTRFTPGCNIPGFQPEAPGSSHLSFFIPPRTAKNQSV